MAAIGFIGTGIMGAPMAANLVAHGHSVRAYGRSARARERARSAGAALFESPAEAVADVDFVVTMLPDGPDVEAVVLGDHGILAAVRSGATLIDMSTINPSVSRELAAKAEAQGVDALDAPVSGGEPAAIEGTLSIMVGGTRQAFDRAEPVLHAMGTNVTYLGGAGSGQVAKAANQLIVASNIQAVAEAIVFLERSGVDVQSALGAISQGLAGSTVLDRKMAAFLSGTFTPGFRVELHVKDLGIVQSTALDLELSLPVSGVVASLMSSLNSLGMSQADHSALLWLARTLNRPLSEAGADAPSAIGKSPA